METCVHMTFWDTLEVQLLDSLVYLMVTGNFRVNFCMNNWLEMFLGWMFLKNPEKCPVMIFLITLTMTETWRKVMNKITPLLVRMREEMLLEDVVSMLMIVSKYMLVMEVFFFEREVWETYLQIEMLWFLDFIFATQVGYWNENNYI